MLRLMVVACLFFLSSLARANPSVLVSIKPLAFIAEAIEDGISNPDILLPAGSSPHTYSARPSDLRRIEQADLFYWIGPEMETFLPPLLKSRKKPSIALITDKSMVLRTFSGEVYDNKSSSSSDGLVNPHIWLSPKNALSIAERMAHDLMQVDPHNKSRYELNLKSFKEQLTQLNAQLKPELKVLKSKKYFVFHDAYGYFESYYGLNHQGAFDLSGSVSPGAKHLAELREQLEQAGSSCLFTESAVRERLAYTLTHGLDVHMVELDPLGYNLSVKPASYSEFLTGLSHRMSSCLQNL